MVLSKQQTNRFFNDSNLFEGHSKLGFSFPSGLFQNTRGRAVYFHYPLLCLTEFGALYLRTYIPTHISCGSAVAALKTYFNNFISIFTYFYYKHVFLERLTMQKLWNFVYS